MALYEVHARKWQNAWELRVEGLGLTWSPTLIDAESRAREHIASSLGVSEGSIHVDLVPRVSDELDQLALEARRTVHEAEEAQRVAAAKAREAVARLTDAGLSPADISRFLGLPQERITRLTEQ
ncbi:hypothetical protein RIF23_04565 [Lipingzhangella sp. LS1_29]|uniref:Antitoxin HicB n=1 Tax=Lipingzhangella rawalii TaxID=2055835 RepID=A0ABU2H4N6_9ACTN|nr:hypothetical protein [Lipingzhangella rawalii]MDS1269569.1 hypothetical protein [Lipingzhangella rawalii]